MASDEFDNLLPIMISAGERTRTIIYVLFLFFGSTALIYLQFNLFDYPTFRKAIVHSAYLCFILNKNDADQVPGNPTHHCKDSLNYISMYYHFPMSPKSTPFEDKNLREAFFEVYKDTWRIYDEHINNPYFGSPDR